ncbi:MAG: ACT domain-containing protein [Candidatus ainarchaeum sp.]|nr:ACT domain-containing protein [Candidatus ainarchaeum sp.]
MKVLTIVADDKVGLLADISYILSKSRINIDSVNVDVVSGKAIITLSISDVIKGKTVLEASGYSVEGGEAVIVKMPDQPGELNRITAMLSKESINIENVHTLSKDGKSTVLSIRTDKPKRAATVLKAYLITRESTY